MPANVAALAGILINVVLPIFLIAGLGFTLRKTLGVDPQPISRAALYLFLPALVFENLFTTHIGADEIGRIGIFTVAIIAIMIVVGSLTGRLLGSTRLQTAGITLAMAFSNGANYGLPVNLFAFGQDGFDRAAIFVVFQSVLTYTAGVFVAARGSLSWGGAMGAALKMPVMWAALSALALRASGLTLPLPVDRAVVLLGGAAVPTVILLLGLQMAGIRVRAIGARTLVSVGARLVASPLIALGLVALLGPAPLTAKVLVLEAAMPTAVNATLIAAEFNAEPQLVSSAALISTALSMITVTAWIAYLQSL